MIAICACLREVTVRVTVVMDLVSVPGPLVPCLLGHTSACFHEVERTARVHFQV